MKPLVVDSLATVIFFTIIPGLTETFLAGMAWGEVAAARATAIPVMLLTARPYGAWRDAVLARAARWPHAARLGRARDTAAEIAAFLSFQVPVYAAILALAGADAAQMGAAISAAVVFMVLLSRPFGLWLELCRRLAGLPPRSPAKSPLDSGAPAP